MTRTISMVSLLVLAACGGPTRQQATISNTGSEQPLAQPAAGASFRNGALWTCQISDYDPQPCKLTQTADGWRLVKLLGSQRFDGTLAPNGSRLDFDGQFFCPWGACDAPMHVQFERKGDASYATVFEGDDIALRYDEALAGEFGAAGYGGLTGHEP